MRRRLVESTLAVAVVAVVLLGVPLAAAGAILQRESARAAVSTAARTLSRAVERRIAENLQVSDRFIADYVTGKDYHAVVVLPGGQRFEVGTTPTGQTFSDQVQTPAGVSVLVEQPRSVVSGDVVRVILLVATVAVVAVGAAVGVGVLQARRLSAPLLELSEAARRLGSGEARLAFERSGLDELDRVAEVLAGSAERIAGILAAERQFASDASHQLRTPLTALSMRLEEIADTDDLEVVRDETRIAQVQVERLASVVDDLLSRARRSRAATAVEIDVDDVLTQQVAEWRPAMAAAARELVLAGERGLRAVVTPGGLGQVISVLVENSLVHGAGRVTLRTRTSGGRVVIEVGDQGRGVPEDLVPTVFERSVSGGTGTGLGLSLARDLAEADGGRLELVRARPPLFALFLTAGDDSSEPSGGAAMTPPQR